eukprot:228559-Pelagomonas_calceolata.AAC.2
MARGFPEWVTCLWTRHHPYISASRLPALWAVPTTRAGTPINPKRSAKDLICKKGAMADESSSCSHCMPSFPGTLP